MLTLNSTRYNPALLVLCFTDHGHNHAFVAKLADPFETEGMHKYIDGQLWEGCLRDGGLE